MSEVGNLINESDKNGVWAPWLDALRPKKRLVLTAAVSFAVVFYIASKMLLREPWEAIALAKVGKVRGELIEPVAMAVDRLNSAGFLEELAISPQDGGDAEALAQLRRSFRARVTSSSLIEIRVRGRNEHEARQFVTGVVATLQRAHAGLAEPAVALMERRRAQLQGRVKIWEAQFATVSEHLASLAGAPTKARREGDTLTATLLHEQFRSQLHDLEAEIATLDRQLDTSQTTPSALIAAPELRQIGVGWWADTIRAALGLGFGLVFAVLLALTIHRR